MPGSFFPKGFPPVARVKIPVRSPEGFDFFRQIVFVVVADESGDDHRDDASFFHERQQSRQHGFVGRRSTGMRPR